MNDQTKNTYQSPEELEMKGEFISSIFSMEPGVNYGDKDDAYFIEVNLPNIPGGTISFGSYDQLKEFAGQLSQYVERMAGRNK